MNTRRRIEHLERRLGVDDECPLCEARAAKIAPADAGLRVVQSWTYEVKCPQRGSPFTVRIDYVEGAALPSASEATMTPAER